MYRFDIDKETVVACVRRIVDGKVQCEARTFNTTTQDLQTLLSCLKETRCTHVGMDATGVYWKPIWNILSDGDFDLVLANAKHIKNVPGQKTDVINAMWIADLLPCGLIQGGFVPDQNFRELRSLLRTRKQLVGEQTRHTRRIQKTLQKANVKLDCWTPRSARSWARAGDASSRR